MTNTNVPQHASLDALQQWIWKTAKAADVEVPIHPPVHLDTAFPVDEPPQQPPPPDSSIPNTTCPGPASPAPGWSASSLPVPTLKCDSVTPLLPGLSDGAVSLRTEGGLRLAVSGAEQLIDSTKTEDRGPAHEPSAMPELAQTRCSGLDVQSASLSSCMVDVAAPCISLDPAQAATHPTVEHRLGPASPCHDAVVSELGQKDRVLVKPEDSAAEATPPHRGGFPVLPIPATAVTGSKLLGSQERLPMLGAHTAEQTHQASACQVPANDQQPSHKPATLSQLQPSMAPTADLLDSADYSVHTAPVTSGTPPDLFGMSDLQLSHSSHTQPPHSMIQNLDAQGSMLQPGEDSRIAGGVPSGQSQLGHIRDQVTDSCPAPSVPDVGQLLLENAATSVQKPVPASLTANDLLLDLEAELFLEEPSYHAALRVTPAGAHCEIVVRLVAAKCTLLEKY